MNSINSANNKQPTNSIVNSIQNILNSSNLLKKNTSKKNYQFGIETANSNAPSSPSAESDSSTVTNPNIDNEKKRNDSE